MKPKCPICFSEQVCLDYDKFFCHHCNYENNHITLKDYEFVCKILNTRNPILEIINSVINIENQLKIIKKKLGEIKNIKTKINKTQS